MYIIEGFATMVRVAQSNLQRHLIKQYKQNYGINNINETWKNVYHRKRQIILIEYVTEVYHDDHIASTRHNLSTKQHSL